MDKVTLSHLTQPMNVVEATWVFYQCSFTCSLILKWGFVVCVWEQARDDPETACYPKCFYSRDVVLGVLVVAMLGRVLMHYTCSFNWIVSSHAQWLLLTVGCDLFSYYFLNFKLCMALHVYVCLGSMMCMCSSQVYVVACTHHRNYMCCNVATYSSKNNCLLTIWKCA